MIVSFFIPFETKKFSNYEYKAASLEECEFFCVGVYVAIYLQNLTNFYKLLDELHKQYIYAAVANLK
jgi:hypothetical protein